MEFLGQLDRAFSRTEDLFRVAPAVWQGSSPFAMKLDHWHAHTRPFRRPLKKREWEKGRLDVAFLCPTVLSKMAEMKLRSPALFFYLN